MNDITIRAAERSDVALLDQALRALSLELGDPHPTERDLLERGGFGATPAFYARIALKDNTELCGAVIYSPVLSTTLAATGLYVSDLWVAAPSRGSGLGRSLLADAARSAEALWGAGYLKLAVYHTSHDARRFYDQLGFVAREDDTTMVLDTSGFDTLKGSR